MGSARATVTDGTSTHRAPRADAGAVVALGRRQDHAVAQAARGRPDRRTVDLGDDAQHAAGEIDGKHYISSTTPRFDGWCETANCSNGRRCSAIATARRARRSRRRWPRPRRAVRHRLAGHPAAAREGARRHGQRFRPAAVDAGAGAAAAQPRAGSDERDSRAHGEGRRRNEPLGGIRLRHHQRRHRSRLRGRAQRSWPPSASSASGRPGCPTSCAACRPKL